MSCTCITGLSVLNTADYQLIINVCLSTMTTVTVSAAQTVLTFQSAEMLQDDENSIKQSEQGIWDPFSVEDLLHRGVASQLEALQTISVNASKEYGLEKALDKMHADWDGLEFRIIEYKDTGTYIVGGTDDIQVNLFHL